MAFKIPYASKAYRFEPLKWCIERTAKATGTSPYLVALIMSHFLEAVADQLCLGKGVRIPGFGMFGLVVRRWNHGRASSQHMAPVLIPARGFLAQVNAAISTDKLYGVETRRYAVQHAMASMRDPHDVHRKQDRVFTAQMKFRGRLTGHEEGREYRQYVGSASAPTDAPLPVDLSDRAE